MDTVDSPPPDNVRRLRPTDPLVEARMRMEDAVHQANQAHLGALELLASARRWHRAARISTAVSAVLALLNLALILRNILGK